MNSRLKGETGQALVAALAAITLLGLMAAAVLALSSGQVTFTARDRRGVQALNTAEAGANHALWALENDPTYTGDTSPVAFQDGTYQTAITVNDDPETDRQYRIVESTGTVGQGSTAVRRKVRVRVEVVPQAFTNSIFATFNIFTSGATKETFLAPLDWQAAGAKGADMGSNQDIIFKDKGIRLNYRGTPPTTYDSLFGPPNPPRSPVPPGSIIVRGQVRGTAGEVYTTIDQLEDDFKYLDMASIVPLTHDIVMPLFDFSPSGPFITLAHGNTTNQPNPGDDGYYTAAEFATLFSGRTQVDLSGMIYVDGNVTIPQNKTLRITGGGLVVHGDVTINNNSNLTVTHDTATQYYPGVFSYSTEGDPALIPPGTGSQITIYGTFNVHGLVYAEMTVFWNGYAQVKGGVMVSNCQDDERGFENQNSTIVCQYDPAVQNTIGVIPVEESPTSYTISVKQVMYWRDVAP